jgi:hypothetical protein
MVVVTIAVALVGVFLSFLYRWLRNVRAEAHLLSLSLTYWHIYSQKTVLRCGFCLSRRSERVAQLKEAAAVAKRETTVESSPSSPVSTEMQLLRPDKVKVEELCTEYSQYRLPHELIDIFETPKHWRLSSRSLVG